jgi:hypothetical protein
MVGFHTRYSGNIPELLDDATFTSKKSLINWIGTFSGTYFDNEYVPNSVAGLINKSLRTGVQIEENELTLFSRYRIVKNLNSNKNCRVYFSSLPFADTVESVKKISEKIPPLMGEFLSQKDQLSARYMLALDGYDGPSSLYWMLRTKSVVFRQIGKWDMYGDSRFHPWVHYVPIEPNAEDILNKFQWCEENIPICENIVSNANNAWSEFFDPKTQDSIINYLHYLYHCKINQ